MRSKLSFEYSPRYRFGEAGSKLSFRSNKKT